MISVITRGVAAALVLSASALAGPAFAADDGSETGKAKPRTEVIELTATNTGTTRIASSEQNGIGSQILITSDLARGNDDDYGKEATICTQMSPTPGAELCRGTWSLRDGEISWQHLQPAPGTAPPTEFDVAITGGTGAYSTARGYAHITRTSVGTEGEYTIHLER
ncbi:hypothetical protein ACTVZO_39365 [Streptomyces sp. IBSNAI002]|uniref:hypothetical protein n=1 Tax=Streptomyces sp. IBSNAI002 TaxID=3457500 RepID=UPI003FD1EA8D